jgi:hypothetical protein
VIVHDNRGIALLSSVLAMLLIGTAVVCAEESPRDVYFDANAVGVTAGAFDTASNSSPAPAYAPLRSWSPDLSQPVEFTKPGPWHDYSSWKSGGGSESFARVRVKSD